MNVIDAVNKRISVRQFTDKTVEHDVLRQLVIDASRAPSGGNVQPWRIYVLEKEATDRLRGIIAANPEVAPPEYDIYPSGLIEPYRTNRFELGEQMYAKLGIPREDKAGRLRQMAKNMQFFDAPASMFCFIDRSMGAPQWSDLGMYLQTFMLLATERGLSTCAQEYWSVQHKAVREFCGAPDNELLFCGMAIGYADESAPASFSPRTTKRCDQRLVLKTGPVIMKPQSATSSESTANMNTAPPAIEMFFQKPIMSACLA